MTDSHIKQSVGNYCDRVIEKEGDLYILLSKSDQLGVIFT